MQEPENAKQVIEYRFHGYRLDLNSHSLYGPDGEIRSLSSRALDTLKILIEHRGQVLTKNFLLETVWPDTFVQENNLNQVISSIRRALDDSKNASKFIKTLIGKGYCFVSDLEIVEASALSKDTQQPADKDTLDIITTSALPGPDTTHLIRRNHILPLTRVSAFILLLFGVLGVSSYFLGTMTRYVPDSNNAIPGMSAIGDEVVTSKRNVIPGAIAVMPFTNLTPDVGRTQKIFSLGLHDELINQLSQVTNLTIISPETFKSASIKNLPLQEIGQKLLVESVITGSVLFVDDLANIKLQMLDPETGVVTWAYDYDLDTGSLKDMIYANRDMAVRVSQTLQADIGQVNLPSYPVSPTESFEAYRYNLASRRAYFNQDFEKSLALSKKALALDPNFHGALYNFSRAHYYMASSPTDNMSTHDHLKMGLESAQRLIDLAPDKHEGYVMKALALAAMGQWLDAMNEIHRLEKMHAPLWELQPLAPVLLGLGEYQLTIDILEESLQTSPLNGNSRGFLMAAYEAVGNSMQARIEYETGDELTPRWWGDVVNFFQILGRGEVINDLENFQGTSNEVKALLASIYDGDRDRTLATLNDLYFQDAPTTSRNVHYAAIAATLGEHDLAIKFLMRSTESLPLHLHWIWQPVFRETWGHPDFIKLLENAGVMDYWQEHGAPDICRSTELDYFVCSM